MPIGSEARDAIGTRIYRRVVASWMVLLLLFGTLQLLGWIKV
jgi:hypothetical protein